MRRVERLLPARFRTSAAELRSEHRLHRLLERVALGSHRSARAGSRSAEPAPPRRCGPRCSRVINASSGCHSVADRVRESGAVQGGRQRIPVGLQRRHLRQQRPHLDERRHVSGRPRDSTWRPGSEPRSAEGSPRRCARRPLRITNPGSQRSTQGRAVSLQLKLTGPPAGAVTWKASRLPPGLSISPSTGRISGTPTRGGPYSVVVSGTYQGSAARPGRVRLDGDRTADRLASRADRGRGAAPGAVADGHERLPRARAAVADASPSRAGSG